jgi:hypothetical protein
MLLWSSYEVVSFLGGNGVIYGRLACDDGTGDGTGDVGGSLGNTGPDGRN